MEEDKKMTVGELRKALEGVPDDFPLELWSDSGVDQGLGEIVIEKAWRHNNIFVIYANDHCDDVSFYDPNSKEAIEMNEKLDTLLKEADEILKRHEGDS